MLSRRTIYRALFLLLGFVPLCGTVGFAAWRQVALRGDGAQQWIAGQLGLDVQVQGTVHPKPGVIRFEQARVLDPETGDPLAKCDAGLTITQRELAVGIRIPSAEIPQDKFSQLLQLLHDRLLQQSRLLDRAVFVTVDDVTLTAATGNLKLSELRLEAERGPDGPYAGVRFRMADRPAADVVTLHVSRDQTVRPAVTRIDLQSKDAPLPCSLFCELPANLPLGNDVTFAGSVMIRSHERGWKGTAFGRFGNVNAQDAALIQKLGMSADPVSGEPTVDFTIDHSRTILNGVEL